jgi:hypothetical protein
MDKIQKPGNSERLPALTYRVRQRNLTGFNNYAGNVSNEMKIRRRFVTL